MRARALLPALCLALFLALPATLPAQTRYLAVGDSITFGVGDETELGGYPPRLEELLEARGEPAVVESLGVPGETSAEALSRIDDALAEGGDVLLLMEGTNDVGARISPESTRFNLDQIAARAAERGLETVHLTVVPRQPTANFDGANRLTGRLAAEIRDLAWSAGRRLADPFEVFRFQVPDAFDTLYVGGDDKLHPNAAGYERLAEVVADVLTGVDSVGPVPGVVFPEDDAQSVDPEVEVRVDLYDFGTGIDLADTELVINDEALGETLEGDERKVTLRFLPTTPFQGVVFVGVRSRDQADPANVIDRRLVQFVVEGTEFLDGDIDRDGRVDGVDLVAFGLRFGSRSGEARYRTFADFNDDGTVDGEDLALLASNFGRASG